MNAQQAALCRRENMPPSSRPPPLQPGARLSVIHQQRANTPLAQTVECATLIIGSGASGIAGAISAALAGLDVEATRKAV